MPVSQLWESFFLVIGTMLALCTAIMQKVFFGMNVTSHNMLVVCWCHCWCKMNYVNCFHSMGKGNEHMHENGGCQSQTQKIDPMMITPTNEQPLTCFHYLLKLCGCAKRRKVACTLAFNNFVVANFLAWFGPGWLLANSSCNAFQARSQPCVLCINDTSYQILWTCVFFCISHDLGCFAWSSKLFGHENMHTQKPLSCGHSHWASKPNLMAPLHPVAGNDANKRYLGYLVKWMSTSCLTGASVCVLKNVRNP